ncbi:ubiquilin-like protein [Octodon degus]|uniref:Ubiquilin-like protein n=1 Tax=Octodon degus TaxID=10160 RepID=A0A6P3FAK8_OCTDE|nr:ubiquilin-like protein [Octodon degus]
MPHVTSRAPRTPQSGRPSCLPTGRSISSRFTRVTVKTPTKQKEFTVAEDITVRQFKEKLLAHFKGQMDQLVLVFMGRLLKDQDTLSQWGVTDGHTIYLVIKSKNSSRSLAHSSQNLPTDYHCHQYHNIKGNSSGVCQPAGMSQAPVKSLSIESDAPKVQNQHLEVDSPQCAGQMLQNLHVQQLLSSVEFVQQFISEHLDKQELIQQNPEAAHLCDNSESLRQTLELIRNLAVIQEIMQMQPPAHSAEHLLNLQPYLGLETIPGGNNVQGENYADFSDRMFSSMQDPFGGNHFTGLPTGQVTGRVQPSPPPPPSSQDQCGQHSHLPINQVICTNSPALSSIISSNTTPNYTSRTNSATISNKGQSHVCAIQQPPGIPALLSIEAMRQLQEANEDGNLSVCSSDQRSEEDLQLSNAQASSQITGGMTQLLRNHPHLASQIMLSMSMAQLSEQWGQQLPTFLQQSKLLDLLLALANPKVLQAMLQIEQGLQLLATEAPVLLPCFAPYLSDLGWLPGFSCSYPDTVPTTWNTPDMAEPKRPECCHKSGEVLHRLQSLAGKPSQPPQTPEIRFRRQMKFLQAMGFGNYHANLQALIATEGDTNAAIRKLKKSQGL